MVSRLWPAKSERGKDAGRADSRSYREPEDAAAGEAGRRAKRGVATLCSRQRCTVYRWAGHLARPREPEHALGDDVAEHLRRPRLDRVAAAAELLVVPPAVVEDAAGVAELARELRQPLVRLGPPQLHGRALGAGGAG